MDIEVNSPEKVPDNLSYHRKCYQRFTLKRDIDKLKSQHEKIQAQVDQKEIVDDGEEPRRKSNRVCSDSPIEKNICLFCKVRRVKDSTEETLVQCIDERARDRIIECAKRKGRFDIFGISNLISNEAKYHKSCYRNFTYIPDDEVEPTESETKKSLQSSAFKEVVKFCLDLDTFRPNEIIPLKHLVSIMEDKLKENNLTMDASTRKNFKRELQTQVPSLKFLDSGNEIYVYSKSASIDDIMLKYIKAKEENDQLKNEQQNEEEQFIKCFETLRKEVKQLNDTMPWPPQPEDLTPDKVVIPPMLNMALSRLLKSKDGTLTEKAERLKMSIAQDIIYAVTQGMIIPVLK